MPTHNAFAVIRRFVSFSCVCLTAFLLTGCAARPKDDRPTFVNAAGPDEQLATLKNTPGGLLEAATVFRVDDAIVRYKIGPLSSNKGEPLKLTPGRHRITAVLEWGNDAQWWAQFPHDFEAGHVYRLTWSGFEKRILIVDESLPATMPDGSPRPQARHIVTRGKPPWGARRQYDEDGYMPPNAPYGSPF